MRRSSWLLKKPKTAVQTVQELKPVGELYKLVSAMPKRPSNIDQILKSLLQQGVDPALIKHVSDYVAGVRKGAKSRLFPERRDSTQALRGLDKGFKQR